MFLGDGAEDAIPVGPAEMSRSTKGGDRILLGTNILNDDVRHVVFLDLGRQVDVDLNAVLGVLLLNGVQERVEPFRSAKVTNDPCEVDLGETSRLRGVEVVETIPNRLQDAVTTRQRQQ